MLYWHEKRTLFSPLPRVENMKFPEFPKTWEALLSDIPIPILAMHQLGREQVHQALTGREERDFLYGTTKISKHCLPTTGFSRDLLNLFPKRKEKDQFTKITRSWDREMQSSNSQPEPGRVGLSSASQASSSLGSMWGPCAATLAHISNFKLRHLTISWLLLGANNFNKSSFFHPNTSC